MQPRQFTTDLAIVGTGIAGCSSALFARKLGIDTLIVGNTGSLAYTSGYFDLFGANENDLQPVIDPWLAISQLRDTHPNYPLARLTPEEIKSGFTILTDFLGENGLAYTAPGQENVEVLTPAGMTKKTLCLPMTMLAGASALKAGSPAVIIDFKGLKGFSGRQIVANLHHRWPHLSCRRMNFPGMEHGELYPEMAARSLEVPANREQFATQLLQVAGDVQIIGLPAILGIHRPDRVKKALEDLTGRTIFELPTMPPSVAGVRIRELVEQTFPALGVQLIPQQKIKQLSIKNGSAELRLTDNFGPIEITAKAVILATGRFLSGGLSSRITGIVEPLLDLPVYQPNSREDWYREQYLDRNGHAVHTSGLEVDDQFRPLGSKSKTAYDNLFCAGSVLAHQDWIRNRSGAGIAIGSAWRAVQSAHRFLNP